jgi:hypothetical protein
MDCEFRITHWTATYHNQTVGTVWIETCDMGHSAAYVNFERPEPVSVDEAHKVIERLREHYMVTVKRDRWTCDEHYNLGEAAA